MPVIPVLCRLRQDDLKFKASLGYVMGVTSVKPAHAI
jgi:hypothetical protein